MHLEVQRCPEAEFAHCVGIEEKAFRHGSKESDNVLFPGPFAANATDIRVAEMVKELEDDPSGVWLKVIDTDAQNPNEGIAYARWYVYKDKVAGARPARVWGEVQGANGAACDKFFGKLGEKMQVYVGGRNCLFLNILVTDPDHWRRGAGALLVKWGVDKADEWGIPAYLESTEAGRRVYTKCGFEEREVVEVDLSQYGAKKPFQAWIMYYEPKTKAST